MQSYRSARPAMAKHAGSALPASGKAGLGRHAIGSRSPRIQVSAIPNTRLPRRDEPISRSWWSNCPSISSSWRRWIWGNCTSEESLSARERLRHFPDAHRQMQRRKRVRLVDEHERVVAARDDRGDVVAPMFLSRIVHDANRAVGYRLIEARKTTIARVVEDNQSTAASVGRLKSVVHHIFPASGTRFGDAHALHRRAPLLAGDHAAVV